MKINFKDLDPIRKYLRPYKKAVWTTAVFAVFEKIIQLASPVLYGKAIDIVSKNKGFSQAVLLLLGSWIILDLARGFFMRARIKRANRLAVSVSNDFITASISHLTKLPLSFHKNKKIGEVIQRFTRAEEYFHRLLNEGLFETVPNILTSCFVFAVIAWINWKLAVIYLIFVLVFIFITIKKTNPIIESRKKINKVFEAAYGDIFDRTPNIIAIKSNSTESVETGRNVNNFTKIYDKMIHQISLWMKLQLLQDVVFKLSFFVIFIASLWLVGKNEMSIGQLVMILAYINMTSGTIMWLGGQYKTYQEGLATIGRANKIFDETSEDYDNPDAITLKNINGDVEFQRVKFSYEKETVLDNINFKVKAGQMVAVVGKSGEGKSTLVDLISRYNLPQKGKILLDGTDIKKLQLKFLRDQIAIVPQEVDLFNDTIKNNIAYSKIGATQKEVERASKLAHCHEFISKFPKKYSQVVGEKGVKLSTGQKQRVAIARAILRDPKILILDEATSALDSESEKYVQEALQEVMKGRTTFVIAHRFSTIRKADLILVIEDGKIVESGDHHELLAHGGVYQKLSELQNISV